MSDFNRWNTAAPGHVRDTVAVDAGLRAYMLRVYNYMATAVALTGVVAWFTFQAAVTTDASGGDRRHDLVRPDDLQRPGA